MRAGVWAGVWAGVCSGVRAGSAPGGGARRPFVQSFPGHAVDGGPGDVHVRPPQVVMFRNDDQIEQIAGNRRLLDMDGQRGAAALFSDGGVERRGALAAGDRDVPATAAAADRRRRRSLSAAPATTPAATSATARGSTAA